jgi:hypothetical protein
VAKVSGLSKFFAREANFGECCSVYCVTMRHTLRVHPVREALRARRPLDKVQIAKGSGGPRIQEIIDPCRDHSVPVWFKARDMLDGVSKGISHQATRLS